MENKETEFDYKTKQTKKHTMSSFAEMKQWLYELFYINLKLGNAKHRCIFLHAKRKASLESIHLSSRELH